LQGAPVFGSGSQQQASGFGGFAAPAVPASNDASSIFGQSGENTNQQNGFGGQASFGSGSSFSQFR
jgi:hypothetical protein